jgi:hypothetical protein
MTLLSAVFAADTGTVRVTVAHAMAVGVFPPFTQHDLDNDDGSIREGTSHVGFALEDIAKCVAPLKIDANLELAHTVVVVDQESTYTFRFTDTPGESVGIILAAPGKKPLVIYASAGPSSLQWLAVDAAASYFGIPACTREIQ